MTSIPRGFGTDPVRAHRPPAPALHSSPALPAPLARQAGTPGVSIAHRTCRASVRPATRAAHDPFSLARDPVNAIQSP